MSNFWDNFSNHQVHERPCLEQGGGVIDIRITPVLPPLQRILDERSPFRQCFGCL